jgi:hypothetical protein
MVAWGWWFRGSFVVVSWWFRAKGAHMRGNGTVGEIVEELADEKNQTAGAPGGVPEFLPGDEDPEDDGPGDDEGAEGSDDGGSEEPDDEAPDLPGDEGLEGSASKGGRRRRRPLGVVPLGEFITTFLDPRVQNIRSLTRALRVQETAETVETIRALVVRWNLPSDQWHRPLTKEDYRLHHRVWRLRRHLRGWRDDPGIPEKVVEATLNMLREVGPRGNPARVFGEFVRRSGLSRPNGPTPEDVRRLAVDAHRAGIEPAAVPGAFRRMLRQVGPAAAELADLEQLHRDRVTAARRVAAHSTTPIAALPQGTPPGDFHVPSGEPVPGGGPGELGNLDPVVLVQVLEDPGVSPLGPPERAQEPTQEPSGAVFSGTGGMVGPLPGSLSPTIQGPPGEDMGTMVPGERWQGLTERLTEILGGVREIQARLAPAEGVCPPEEPVDSSIGSDMFPPLWRVFRRDPGYPKIVLLSALWWSRLLEPVCGFCEASLRDGYPWEAVGFRDGNETNWRLANLVLACPGCRGSQSKEEVQDGG